MRTLAISSLLLLCLLPLRAAEPGNLRVSSFDFAENTLIPARFTCEGADVSPTLEVAGVPPGARSLALIFDDPDAPGGLFTHWIVWNIPPATAKIVHIAALAGAVQGTNDFGKLGYSGPCPPSGIHRYIFHISALDTVLNLRQGASRGEIDRAMHGHILATGSLMAIYSKKASANPLF